MDTLTQGISTKNIYFASFSEVFRVKLDNLVSVRDYIDGFGIVRESEGAES